MDQLIIKHVPQYGVIICMLCKEHHAISPDSVGIHYSSFHSASISKLQRAELIKYTKTLTALNKPDQVKLITPTLDDGPVDGLHKIHGYECKDCLKLLPKLTSMEKHCHKHHGWGKRGKTGNHWTQKWMQVIPWLTANANVTDIFHSNTISQLLSDCRRWWPTSCNIKSTEYQSPPRTYQSQRTRTRLYTSYNGPRNQQSRPTTVDEGYKLAQDVCRVGHENFSGRLSETKRWCISVLHLEDYIETHWRSLHEWNKGLLWA